MMDLAESRQVNILGAANEICQVILLSKRIKSPPKITFSIKSKGQTSHIGVHLYCIKENCLPHLSQVVCKMQDQEKESHLALQAVNERNCQQRKTKLLWLETESETSSVTVHILSETITPIKTADQMLTVLEIRVFLPVNDIIHFIKGMLNLLERIKLLNPKVQMSFSLHSLTSVEVDLSSTKSISCEAFLIYSGYDLFLGRNTPQFTCQMLKVKSSKSFQITFQGKNSVTETASLTCISCFVPICPAQKQSTIDGNLDSCPAEGQGNLGQVRRKIQVYGPANLPFDMKVVTERLTLKPDSLLPWHRLGLQVKKSFSCSSYDLHCSARITNKKAVPSWAAQCQHFCMMIAFILSKKECSADDENTTFRHQEQFRHVEQHALNTEVYSTFQEAAYTCVANLLSQDKVEVSALQEKPLTAGCQDTHSDLFRKMIPDVANSLTDIFIRSTCMEFRSQVAALVPTSSRSSMSTSLSESLWQMIFKPRDHSQSAKPSDVTTDTTEELQLANLDISQDSLFSVEGEDKAMSPDSLDLEWENSCPSTLYQDEATPAFLRSLSEEVTRPSHSVPAQHSTIDRSNSDNFQSNEGLSWSPHFNSESFLSSEEELELWEYSEDSLTSVCEDTCSLGTSNTNVCFPPVVQQDKIDLHVVHAGSYLGESSTSQYKHEPLLASENFQDQTVDKLIHCCIAPVTNHLEKMPRKRSSEYLDDTVSVDICHVSNTPLAVKTDTLSDGKKTKCQNSDLYSDTNLSHCNWQTTLCTEELSSTQPGLHTNLSHCNWQTTLCTEELSSTQPGLHHFQQDGDALSGCWFDEEEVANWCADLDK